jgi:ferritin
MSRARQNLSELAEEGLNELFMSEFESEYAYLSMASWLKRDPVQLPGLHRLISCKKNGKRDEALKIIKYLNDRGGFVHLKAIYPPKVTRAHRPYYYIYDVLVGGLEISPSGATSSIAD